MQMRNITVCVHISTQTEFLLTSHENKLYLFPRCYLYWLLRYVTDIMIVQLFTSFRNVFKVMLIYFKCQCDFVWHKSYSGLINCFSSVRSVPKCKELHPPLIGQTHRGPSCLSARFTLIGAFSHPFFVTANRTWWRAVSLVQWGRQPRDNSCIGGRKGQQFVQEKLTQGETRWVV